MPAKTVEPKTTDLEVLKRDATKESGSLISKAGVLKIVDEASYILADEMRTKLSQTKTAWEARLEKIIRPAYDVLQGLYGLKREIVKPIEDASVMITSSMKAYKIAERRKIEEEDAKRVLEESRLEREREELQRRIEVAKPAVARVLAKQADRIADKIQRVSDTPVQVAVKVQGSGTRAVKKWKLTDFLALVKAVAAGDLPIDTLEINAVSVNEYFRSDTSANKDAIRSWPGIEVYDDVEIVSSRSKV